MNLKLYRYSDGGKDTKGLLFIDGKFACYTLEDEFRAVKVKGETRIPEGTYKIKFREVISPLTESYRKRFRWFTWHLELQDVPNFQYVYIHVGNKDTDTDGCILVGDSVNNNKLASGFLSNSVQAFTRVYSAISDALAKKESVEIEIVNLEKR